MSVPYLIVPILLLAVVLAAVWLERWSVPVILVALGTGILFGSDALNLWHFDDTMLANQVANMALVFILLHGGFITKRSDFKSVALPAGGLATWGVVLTSLFLFCCLRWGLGWSLQNALLLAVIISSTDAAATFSILKRQSLPQRLGSTLEIESAANDPMAIMLTTVAVASLAAGEAFGLSSIVLLLWQFGIAPAIGYLTGRGAVALYNRLVPEDRGYYYILFLATGLLTYGIAEAVRGSGMLAVFACGFVMGNRSFVHKQGVLNFSEALSTIANIGMFVMLGLLVFPRQWSGLWFEGTLLFLLLTFVARPLAVFIGTAGMKLGWRSRVFISWAGLRGAVPIVLATYPAAAGVKGADSIFNLVFFAVLLSILIQGSTLGRVATWLKLSTPARPKPLFNLELITMTHSDYDLVVVDLPDPPGAAGPRIRDLALPEGAVIALITRRNEVVLPKGNTCLQGWDQVSVLAHAPDIDAVRHALTAPFAEDPERCPEDAAPASAAGTPTPM
jgi:cell volume regulation protein A